MNRENGTARQDFSRLLKGTPSNSETVLCGHLICSGLLIHPDLFVLIDFRSLNVIITT